MKSETGKLQLRLQALQRQYSQELPDKIRQLEKRWRHFAEHKDRQTLDSLLHDIHNLAGSGAIYGYHQISKLARELEQFLVNIQESQRQSNTGDHQRIERCIRALHLAAQSPAQPATPP